jgi:hypothetical protein
MAAGLVLALAGSTSAQCARVSFGKFGTTCAFFNQHATLGASYDQTNCQATLTIGSATTCCNTFLSGQFLILGATKVDPGVPHPLLVRGCLLSVFPDVVLPLPRTAGGKVQLPIPKFPVKVTVYAQGLNDYFTTIGLTHDFQTTQGLQIDIS